MKKFLTLMLIIMMVSSIIGCQSQNPQSDPEATGKEATASQNTPAAEPEVKPAKEPVTIRFWQAGADTSDATNIMNKLLLKFMKENTDIMVEYQAVPWSNDPHTVFQTAIAGGDVADLLIVGSPFDFAMATSGTVQSLTPYLDKAVVDDLMPVSKEGIYTGKNTSLAGQYISVPLFVDARVILYNKEIFDKAGVAYPNTSWTHEEFLSNAEKLTGTFDGKKVYGFGTSARYASQYITFVWNLGGEILNDNMTKAATNNDIWRKAITYYLNFYKKGITPPGSEAMALADMQTMFVNGEIAMMVATSDYAKELQKDEKFGSKLAIGIMPHADKQTAFAGSDVFVIPAIAKNPEAAGRLINFMLKTENQLEYVKNVGFFPAVKSAANNEYFTSDPVKAGFAEGIKIGKFYVKHQISGSCTTILRAQIQQLIGDKITLDQFLANTETEINAALAE